MATLNDTPSIDTTARTSTPATTPTISSPPSDAAAAMDVSEARPPALTRPDQPTPLILMICLEDRTVKLNPFRIEQALKRFKPKQTRDHRNGKVEVELGTEYDAKKLLGTTSLEIRTESRPLSVPVKVIPHATKNSSRGVISCRDLRDVSEEEILFGLKEQGVTEVKRMARKGDNEGTGTGTFMLVFPGAVLPEKVHVGWLSVKVRPFVPSPTRCFKCQAFGHIAGSCKGRERCGKCSEVGHNSKTCEADKPKCAGCGGEHEAWSRHCPKLNEAKKAQGKKAPPPPGPAQVTAPKAPSVPNPSPYRDALVGAQLTPPPTENPPQPPSMDSAISQFSDLSLRQFLAMIAELLPRSKSVGCADKADKSVQTSMPECRDVAVGPDLAEVATPGTEPNTQAHTVNGDPPQREASSKRSREDSPTQPPMPTSLTALPQMSDPTEPMPPPDLTPATKRACINLARIDANGNSSEKADTGNLPTTDERSGTVTDQCGAAAAGVSGDYAISDVPSPSNPRMPPPPAPISRSANSDISTNKPQRSPRSDEVVPRVRVNELVDNINKRVNPTAKNKDDESTTNTVNTVNNRDINTNTNKHNSSILPPPRVPPGFQDRARSRTHSFSHNRTDRPRSHSRGQDSSRRYHSRERPSIWERENTHQNRSLSGGVLFQGPSQPQ